jgi:hypothetical protein
MEQVRLSLSQVFSIIPLLCTRIEPRAIKMHSLLSSIITLLLIPATFAFPGDGILNDVYRHGWVELLSPKAGLVAGATCDYDPASVDWQSMFVFYREVRNLPI